MANNANLSNTESVDINKYADHKTYNGAPIPEGHVLAPVWLTRAMVKADRSVVDANLTTWKIGGISLLIGFTPVPGDTFAAYMKLFWEDINEYLDTKRPGRCVLGKNDDGTPYLCPYGNHCKGCTDCFDEEGKPRERINTKSSKFVSLEAQYGLYNADEEGEEAAVLEIPDTIHMQPDEEVYLEMLFADLVKHLESIHPRYAQIVTLGRKGYEPEEIISAINLKKSRGYQEIKKAEQLTKEFLFQ